MTASGLSELRDGLDEPGQYLGYRTPSDDLVVFRAGARNGRGSAAASPPTIRFDDP